MAQGIADQVGLSYVDEDSTWGTVPASPTLQNLRFTGESLKQDTDSVASREIRSDRQVTDFIRTGVRANGSINFELSYGTYDDFMRAGLLSAAWTSPVTVIATSAVDVTAASNKFEPHTGTWTATPAAGTWIKTSGFSETGNNGYFKVASATSGEIVVTCKNSTLANENASAASITGGAYIVNGTTTADNSFSIERKHSDIASVFEYWTGMMIPSFSMEVPANGLITGTFDFLGKREYSATATIGTGYDTATTTDVMNCIDDVDAFFINEAAYDITGFNFATNNNLRERLEVATLGAVSVGAGKFGVSGGIKAYFEDNTELDYYRDWTTTNCALSVTKSSNTYIFDWPTMKVKAGSAPATGENTDLIADMEFESYMDSAESITMRVSKFPAA